MDFVHRTCDDACAQIADGDLALFRPLRRGLFRRGICTIGRSPWVHAAKLARWDGELMVLETVQWHGARATTLRNQVQRFPGQWDIFEANPDHLWPSYDRPGSIAHLRSRLGPGYGWGTLLYLGLVSLPVVRLFCRTDIDDGSNGRLPVCSGFVAQGERIGGRVDPVPHLADRATVPGDLARSPFYRYRFTLLP